MITLKQLQELSAFYSSPHTPGGGGKQISLLGTHDDTGIKKAHALLRAHFAKHGKMPLPLQSIGINHPDDIKAIKLD